jgi:hypothetical protein
LAFLLTRPRDSRVDLNQLKIHILLINTRESESEFKSVKLLKLI